jgi:5-methylcytosine-specific restriction endonuclease McrA
MIKPERQKIFDMTSGHCHFCGDALVFEHYGKTKRPYLDGAWELDHVIQRGKGGRSNPENYLPACGKCNHLRWHRTGDDLRELILLGLVAKDEIKKGTKLGAEISRMRAKHDVQNARRRMRGDGRQSG